MNKQKENRGVTLISLIITIIVMLLLVGVTVTSVINSGLIGKTQSVGKKTQEKYEEEAQLGNIIEIDGKIYASMEDYVAEIERAPKIMKGEGTEENPYTIENIEGLIQFAYSVTNGKTYEGEYVKLTRNLDFESVDSYINAYRTDYEKYGYTGELITAITTGEGFKPIGNGFESTGNIFSGTFDGNGKVIKNLRINNQNNIIVDIGLFSDSYGTIKNLGIANCDIEIIVDKEDGMAVNCGTICGFNYGNIDSCWSSGRIDVSVNKTNGALRIGGIVGACNNSKNDSVNIKNCYNKVNIDVENNNTEMEYCFVAGVCGAMQRTIISSCYNLGNINASYPCSGTYLMVAGISCKNDGQGFNNCYNVGNVSGFQDSGLPAIGGIVSWGESMNYCYNTGLVQYKGTSAKYVGTMVGALTKTQTNSYYLNNTELNGIGRNYGGGQQPTKVETEAEMPTVLEIMGDEFKEDTNNINNGYPILKWQ